MGTESFSVKKEIRGQVVYCWVTRFASMGSYFDTHSIRQQYLYPSQETMLETYQDLLHQLDASAMRAAAACVALIDVPKTLTQQEQQTLWERLQQFNRQSGMPFLTYRLPNRFEITSCKKMDLKSTGTWGRSK